MLKKVFAVAAALVLTSCSAGSVSTKEISAAYQKDFSCLLIISDGGDRTEMECVKSGLSIALSTVSPGELAGLEMVLTDGRLKLSFEGMETELEFEKLPEKGALRLFCRLLETLALPDEYGADKDGKEITVVGKDFSAGLDGESFGLKSARFPREDIEFAFSGWEFFGGQ